MLQISLLAEHVMDAGHYFVPLIVVAIPEWKSTASRSKLALSKNRKSFIASHKLKKGPFFIQYELQLVAAVRLSQNKAVLFITWEESHSPFLQAESPVTSPRIYFSTSGLLKEISRWWWHSKNVCRNSSTQREIWPCQKEKLSESAWQAEMGGWWQTCTAPRREMFVLIFHTMISCVIIKQWITPCSICVTEQLN